LQLHLDRLARDSKALFDADLDLIAVRSLVGQAASDRDLPVVVRVTVFDPEMDLGHPGSDANPKLLVTTRSASRTALRPLRLTTTPYTREFPAVKHVGLFGALKHRRAAQRSGFDDVLFTDTAGLISEGVTWNIGFISGDQVIWPDSEQLAGVTMELLKGAYANSVIAPVALSDLPSMDGAFATNAAIGIRPICAVGETDWDPQHPVVDALLKEYAAIEPQGL